jgi:hypothetical protein
MISGLVEKITFPCGALSLEGLINNHNASLGVVISHPHPLYGGDMHNDVVKIIHEVFNELGWTTLRFNFRGVGRSQGSFDDGRGEQEDVLAAVAHLKQSGAAKIYLAGYSFGAWVNARAASTSPEVQGSILVSPPLVHFPLATEDARTVLIVSGDSDPFCPLADLKKWVAGLDMPPPVKIIPGADHFFIRGSQELRSALRSFFKERAGGS